MEITFLFRIPPEYRVGIPDMGAVVKLVSTENQTRVQQPMELGQSMGRAAFLGLLALPVEYGRECPTKYRISSLKNNNKGVRQI